MKIKFKDINIGAVQARAVIEIAPDIFINEITILKKGNDIIVELPQKSFKGKGGNIYHLNIITFSNEDKENLWKLEIKNAYMEWRKKNPKILVYEKKS
ncbi:MAG: hypothetical protein ISS28_05105 [Candidatus Cloacimonetes bacterium]|nr:hypothetical protein [Candidatus Cloacimonadota bacterium]MBL7086459.1 hypothetical protein [Candidatus Cloacimonadota bacterium]